MTTPSTPIDKTMTEVNPFKVRVSIIDFLPFHEKFQVGIDGDGEPIFYGDMIEYNGEKNWFLGYRYGTPMLKQVGMMAMISSEKFKNGDFSSIKKVKNTIGAGNDYLIIGMSTEPFIEQNLPFFLTLTS